MKFKKNNLFPLKATGLSIAMMLDQIRFQDCTKLSISRKFAHWMKNCMEYNQLQSPQN